MRASDVDDREPLVESCWMKSRFFDWCDRAAAVVDRRLDCARTGVAAIV